MREFTEEEKKKMWEEARADYPDDEMMQEIRYVRLMLYYQTKDMTFEEEKDFYKRSREALPKASGEG